MSLFVDMNQEETHRSLMDYFTGRRLRILTSHETSFIRAEIGQWISLAEFGKEKGEVQVTVSKRNGGCYVNINFDFSKTYAVSLIIAIFAGLFIYVGSLMILSSSLGEFMVFSSLISLYQYFITLMAFLGFCFAMIVVGYDVSLTKRRFVEELNSFLQSLSGSVTKKS